MWMLVYVLLKICDGTLTGQQAMGLMLMIGVTGLFGSVIPWVLPPNESDATAIACLSRPWWPYTPSQSASQPFVYGCRTGCHHL